VTSFEPEKDAMKQDDQTAARVAALSQAPLNSWIALSDDETRLVAHGTTYQAVADHLDKLGDDTSVILKTPPSWHPLAL
jgi:TPP-dependent indolepyruvate ferredoxin oxidoreductase alpha subunit